MANELKTHRPGRPVGSQYVSAATMVRVTFESAEDQKEILAYVQEHAKGLPLGRAIRNIIKEHMEKEKWSVTNL